jgi:transposase, IS5 family
MKEARRVIGGVTIKHKLCLSDAETVQQIQENPYRQYLVGLPGHQSAEPSAPSLSVEIRKRMGEAVLEGSHRAIIAAHEGTKPVKPEPETPLKIAGCTQSDVEADEWPATLPPGEAWVKRAPEPTAATHQGQLMLDATVAEQAIRSADLSLLNEAREFSGQTIDTLCANPKADKKPRTYREKARSA